VGDDPLGDLRVRIAVTGGRYYSDRQRVFEALDSINRDAGPIAELIHGAAAGADTLAAAWASERGIAITPYPANWDDIDTQPCRIGVRNGRHYNKLAGLNRNREMLLAGEPQILVVFSGGTGTAHCHATALKMGIPTIEVDP
jgi:hypothetical protein